MKKRMLFLLFAVFVLITSSIGQRTNYHQVNYDMLFTKCEQPPKFGKDTSVLEDYLTKTLEKQLVNTHGNITISAYIDTSGKAICHWIDNRSDLNLKKVKLNEIIDSLPLWTCGIQHDYKVNCSELIFLSFDGLSLAATCKTGEH